jgi:cytoskeletal protein CcmA (bactofilin family)
MADAKNTNGSATDKRTVVEEGTLLKGALSSSCPILVRGKIEGELSAPSLTISGSGSVHGSVKVGELRSEGELSGECDADMVQLSGSVKDNTVIRAKSIEVKLTPPNSRMQVIFGECALDVGEAPTKEANVSSKASAPQPSVPPQSASVRPPPAGKVKSKPPAESVSDAVETSVRASVRPPVEVIEASARKAESLPPIGNPGEPEGRG